MTLRNFIDTNQANFDYSDYEDQVLSDLTFVEEIQTALNNAGYNLIVDGIFGRLTREALNDFKADQFLGYPDIFGKTTAEKLIPFLSIQKVEGDFKYIYPPKVIGGRQQIVALSEGHNQKALDKQAYESIAEEYGLEEAVVRAVVEIESNGSGFLLREPTPARPKILFEAHWFYKLTPKPVSRTRPDLSSKSWNRALYKGGSAEWNRLLDAMAFDPIPAMKSASWGLGQVMGFNYKVAGCNSVEQFVIEAHKGEYEQLRHMMNFIKNNHLLDDLQRKSWTSFAEGYNGSQQAVNSYDTKLAASYSRWKNR